MNIVLRRTGALGDVLQCTPIARRLRRENPDAWIGVETQHTAAFYKNPDVNAVLARMDLPVEHRVIDLDHAYERRANMHAIDAYMLEAFGDTGEGHDKTIFAFKGSAPLWVDRNTVVLHPNVSWPNRTLPRGWWYDLSCELGRRGYNVAITGTAVDHDLLGSTYYDTRGQLPLYDQAAMIEAAGCLVCGDSAMFVLVGATETPAVGLCTISRPEFFVPIRHGEVGWRFNALAADVPCYGCREHAGDVTYLDCRYGTNACVSSFDIDRVMEAILNALR